MKPSDSAASGAATAVAAPVTMEQFLDRLMIAESGGRLFAKNPRSTALGPYQFIESTFLGVARRNFASEVASLTPEKILALRTDLAFSRRAAEAYTRENAAVLKSFDVEPTFAHLRLAFLLGPSGAAKVINAPPDAPLAGLLAPVVLIANPFMAAMTARSLIARSAREVNQAVGALDGVAVPAGGTGAKRNALPGVAIRCNLRLPSCKRWVALQTAKLRGKRGPRGGVASAKVLPPPAGLGASKAARRKR